jgi:predicted RNA-binding Zn ribbon-like protein
VVSTAPYAYEVEGVVLPVPVSGDVTLELCNTAAGWGEPDRKEYLRGYDELVVWARESGLVGGGAAARLRAEGQASPAPAAGVLARVLRLREAVYATALGGDAWDAIASEAERAARAARLTPGGWILPERLDLPVLAAARAAAEFLLGERRSNVRACPGRRCGWLFLDPSGRRRWCSMATCGNRAKQRRHAERVSAAR